MSPEESSTVEQQIARALTGGAQEVLPDDYFARNPDAVKAIVPITNNYVQLNYIESERDEYRKLARKYRSERDAIRSERDALKITLAQLETEKEYHTDQYAARVFGTLSLAAGGIVGSYTANQFDSESPESAIPPGLLALAFAAVGVYLNLRRTKKLPIPDQGN